MRIIWIPWPEAEADEFIERSDQWNEVSARTFTIITYDPGTKHDALVGLRDGSIYMRGHGESVGRRASADRVNFKERPWPTHPRQDSLTPPPFVPEAYRCR